MFNKRQNLYRFLFFGLKIKWAFLLPWRNSDMTYSWNQKFFLKSDPEKFHF
jgi:hypothetical protein